jgi:hypothetical protein
MSASTKSTVRRIELVTKYEIDGEPECCVQNLPVQFLAHDTAVVMQSSGIFEDFRILFGDRIVVLQLQDGKYELIGIQHPSPMRHFESTGGGNNPFPEEELNHIGGEWESELMYWTTHIPAAEFDAFCARTALKFDATTEIFSGLSSIFLE